MSHYRDQADGWASNRGGGPAEPVRTYAEFVAHITALAVDGSIGWTSGMNVGDITLRRYRTTSAQFSGSMSGSPNFNRFSTRDIPSTVARIIQHCLPNGDVSGAQAGREVYFEFQLGLGFPALVGQTINGYASSAAAADTTASGTVSKIIWWEGAKAMWRDPSTNGPAIPYTWP